MKEWIPNACYGGHAFGKDNFAQFLAERESILPWIAEFSPCALVSAGDPPVCLFYHRKPPAMGVPSDAIHGANFGIGLQQRCNELGGRVSSRVPWRSEYEIPKSHRLPDRET